MCHSNSVGFHRMTLAIVIVSNVSWKIKHGNYLKLSKVSKLAQLPAKQSIT